MSHCRIRLRIGMWAMLVLPSSPEGHWCDHPGSVFSRDCLSIYAAYQNTSGINCYTFLCSPGESHWQRIISRGMAGKMILKFLSVNCSAQMNTLIRGVGWGGVCVCTQQAMPKIYRDRRLLYLLYCITCDLLDHYSAWFLLLCKNCRDPVLPGKGWMPGCLCFLLTESLSSSLDAPSDSRVGIATVYIT